MNLKDLSKPLPIESIDFRIQSINKGGYATILAYKDARVDMNRLDEVLGPENWQRDHKEIKGVVYCGIGVCTTVHGSDEGDLLDWVWKWDAGSESFTEKQKGEASDSFKRAGFNWGIGRELYDYPLIKVKLLPNEFTLESGRAKQTWDLKLKEWRWLVQFKDDNVSYLGAIDNNNKLRFEYGTKR